VRQLQPSGWRTTEITEVTGRTADFASVCSVLAQKMNRRARRARRGFLWLLLGDLGGLGGERDSDGTECAVAHDDSVVDLGWTDQLALTLGNDTDILQASFSSPA
jgi:hypothetical protein